jgi:hypothetical protein
MIRIEIENRFEEHKWDAVESHWIVAEPAPRESRVLPASESVLLRTAGVGVVEIRVDSLLAPFYLGRPVRHHLAVDPRNDFLTRAVV